LMFRIILEIEIKSYTWTRMLEIPEIGISQPDLKITICKTTGQHLIYYELSELHQSYGKFYRCCLYEIIQD
jgi:hypothetical protein